MPTSRTPTWIAYDRAGPAGGVPVVLLHAGVADRRMWDPQWAGLSATHDTIRLDLRGFGESTLAPRRLDPVQDVLETLHHLGVASCHFIAASFGAGVAVEVALRRPGLVRSIALCPPGGSLITEATPTLRAFFAAEREALARGDLDGAVEANITTWVVGAGRTLGGVDPGVTASVR
ncbi:MAG: alpha/beta fold hydrolase, partial [Ornithinibacter sp.]